MTGWRWRLGAKASRFWNSGELKKPDCLFCEIIRGSAEAAKVFEDPTCVAFLDHRPLFPGHVLLVPRVHVETLPQLPAELIEPLFSRARMLAAAMVTALAAEGSFVAINNTVSQSVPHLHIHIVPRTKGDGLRGFFWPRLKYRDTEHLRRTQELLMRAISA